jgi:two-component system, OmpR family, phosphate regulon response regulator PhoB
MPKVLIVDDEIDLVRLVQYNLEKEGFEVLTAYDGKTTFTHIHHAPPDLLILDLMLPDMSGIKICQQIKSDLKTKAIPVIMLTARSSESDRVSGFEAGADDYVVKPFSPKELVLRVKAMLARTKSTRSADLTRIQIGDIVIFPEAHLVETTGGRQINLSLMEFKLLLTLAQNANMVRTREQLILDIWEQDGENISDRTVDTHIKRLRQKLGAARDIIETIRGVGYRIIPITDKKALPAS